MTGVRCQQIVITLYKDLYDSVHLNENLKVNDNSSILASCQ